MEYYYWKIVAWLGQYIVEFICFFIAVFLWGPVYDFFIDKVPRDKGFWSRKTGHDKFDVTHVSKWLGQFFFAVGLFKMIDIYYLVNNIYVWAALSAWLLQKVFYHGILPLIFRKRMSN